MLAAHGLGVDDAPDEERGALTAGIALVFINRHACTSASCPACCSKSAVDVNPSHTIMVGEDTKPATQVFAITTGGDEHGHSDREPQRQGRKSTRLNSSHQIISYAVFCLKKKNR